MCQSLHLLNGMSTGILDASVLKYIQQASLVRTFWYAFEREDALQHGCGIRMAPDRVDGQQYWYFSCSAQVLCSANVPFVIVAYLVVLLHCLMVGGIRHHELILYL